MRKFVLIMAVLVIVGTAFADVMPPYVVIGNAEKVTGGNDAVYVSENAGENLDGSPVPDIVSNLTSKDGGLNKALAD